MVWLPEPKLLPTPPRMFGKNCRAAAMNTKAMGVPIGIGLTDLVEA